MSSTSRRSVVKGAAWTAPLVVLAAPAPAFAASQGCPSGQEVPGWLLSSASGEATGVAFSPSEVTGWFAFSFDGYPPGTPLRPVVTTPPVVPLPQYLRLRHPAEAAPGAAVTTKLTLSQPVANLSFTVFAIDRVDESDTSEHSWADHVVIDTPGYTIPVRDACVVGAGTVSDPLRSSCSGEVTPVQNTARVLWAGPVSEVQLTYIAAGPTIRAAVGQYIGLGSFGITC